MRRVAGPRRWVRGAAGTALAATALLSIPATADAEPPKVEVSVVASPSRVARDRAVTAYATIRSTTGAPLTGTVTVSLDGKPVQTSAPDAAGNVRYTASGLNGGPHEFMARYDGDPENGADARGAGTVVTDWYDADESEVRMAGTDRIGTAVAVSHAAYDAGSRQNVVIASGDGFPDALAAGPFASAVVAPLLLNSGAKLDARVAMEVRRVLETQGAHIFVVGGTAAVPETVVNDLRALGVAYVTRIAGRDRYDTALQLAHAEGDPPGVVLTTGLDFPDALAGGVLAGDQRTRTLLLTAGSTLPRAVREYVEHGPNLWRAPGIVQYTVGAPAAKAYPQAEAIVGSDRYETAAKVASTLGGSPTAVALVSGQTYADALAASATLGRPRVPLVLTTRDALPPATEAWITEHHLSLERVGVFGGAAAVSGGAAAEAARLAN